MPLHISDDVALYKSFIINIVIIIIIINGKLVYLQTSVFQPFCWNGILGSIQIVSRTSCSETGVCVQLIN